MKFRRVWQVLVYGASFEWLLTSKRPNGGDVVLGRAMGVALLVCSATLALRNLIDPTLGREFSLGELRKQVIEIAPWFAAAVGAVYAAFYARFSSQWSYLASLYNQIKQAELELACSDSKNEVEARKKLNEWKAGYIEDAHDLHLHAKENIAAIIHFWGRDAAVASTFAAASAGGQKRWDKVYREASAAHALATHKHLKRG